MSIKTGLIALTLAAAIPAAVYAASDSRAEPRRGPDVERLAERLGLDEEQQAKVRALFEEQRAKREAMREETRARMAEVLTPEQLAKLEQMREKRREHRKEHRKERHAKRHGHERCESHGEGERS